jgi:hypothetical protein
MAQARSAKARRTRHFSRGSSRSPAEGERIRDYTEDRPFPSALFLEYFGGRPLHVVASCDQKSKRAFIITAYEPSLEVFEPDYRTKKKI